MTNFARPPPTSTESYTVTVTHSYIYRVGHMMDTLNFGSTGMCTILVLIVNVKWNACKKWTSSLKLFVFTQCRYTKIAQRIFKYSNIQHCSLTLDKKLNSLIYRVLFYVNIYGSYKLLKTVRFWPTLYITMQHADNLSQVPCGSVKQQTKMLTHLHYITN